MKSRRSLPTSRSSVRTASGPSSSGPTSCSTSLSFSSGGVGAVAGSGVVCADGGADDDDNDDDNDEDVEANCMSTMMEHSILIRPTRCALTCSIVLFSIDSLRTVGGSSGRLDLFVDQGRKEGSTGNGEQHNDKVKKEQKKDKDQEKQKTEAVRGATSEGGDGHATNHDTKDGDDWPCCRNDRPSSCASSSIRPLLVLPWRRRRRR